jgi:subtilisin family serine protease
MTWTVLAQQKGYVHVGSDAITNPYTGDTTIDQFLPILCVLIDRQAPPAGIPFGFYDGWLQGQVRATPAVPAVVLTSREQADFICADTFGAGWRLAEFHDGRYGSDFSLSGGWSFWGAGSLPAGTRFWVAINDQPANPWNSAGAVPETVPTPKFVLSEAPVPGQYLAMFSEDTPEDSVDLMARMIASSYGVTLLDIFSAVQGFSFTGSEAQARAMSEDSQVESVEEDSYGQPAEYWHLDRIDQRTLPLPDFAYAPPNDGSGVNIYVLDSGFRRSHQEFGGRARQDADFIRFLGSRDDCDGHGTAVGSLAGGATVGVARGATLISIRISGCKANAYNPLISVFSSTIVAGLDWVARFHQSPAVANVSYGFGPGFWRRWLNLPTPMDRAVKRAVKAGVAVIVSAGNEGKNADRSSPARAAEAISVSSTDQLDRRPDWANYGKVNLFAPGVDIVAAGLASDSQYVEGDGTSLSAPLATGAAALYLHDNPTATPAQVRNALEGTATPGVVLNPGSGSANRLLFIGRTSDVGVIPEAGAVCPGETISFQMDDEDNNNANSRSGWLGRIQSSNNTIYTFCRVNGTDFHPAVSGGPVIFQSYAVLKLGATCPAGAVEYLRHFDNEDRRNANWVSGGVFPNLIDNNSTLNWCVFLPVPAGPAFAFPNLGFGYGVVAPPTFSLALATGWIYQDDEDNRNDDWYLDLTQSPPLYSLPSPIPNLINGDHNTQTFLAKVR